ncbi:GNAT family N-acetyltransferase [Campylobacter sp. 2352 PW]|uniref:GNAT family N-acetyltransferase n=1 Tax=unclassified Campylobacter TaxID=2593542 RepID=UPI0017DD26AC|nr:GNAT family N-acetyltransferase [Campylobacter sp. RKI_CA19_01116]EAH4571013.1 N-acetyltransferase [Campylobacter lari]MCR8704657.1 GNAT family N-acetyltransferase [Campylobacter sp. 2352 PW]MCV3396898.1 GNAT family N-acetyltransferase [Campylobacter sp. RKI_CA19_01116]HEC1769543.1 GNAT family N-acetyltransferase [Campylobacter lari]
MIRKARKDDVKKCIQLLALAMDHFIYKLSGYNDHQKAIEVLENFFTQENNRLSYENIYVYEEDREILGAICFYDGALADELDKPLNEHLEFLGINEKVLKECENEFYLDSICVDEKARGKGIAKKLIECAFNEALKNGKKLSLIVEDENINAKMLYEKMGFKFIKNKIFHSHKYEYREKGE